MAHRPAVPAWLARSVAQLAESHNTDATSFTLATWNVLADGLAQTGGWVHVRIDVAPSTVLATSTLCASRELHAWRAHLSAWLHVLQIRHLHLWPC